MSGKTDDLKGRAKEALGDLTDDERLEREGQVDQAAAAMKKKVDKAAEAIKEKIKPTS
jgi:uncharacterized protein YjbJ (UPF0337 family)